MILYAVDPATKKSGVAVFQDGKFKTAFKVQTDIKEFTKLFSYDDFLLAIETQFQSFNQKTFADLLTVRVAIEMVATFSGKCKGIYRVQPSRWQMAVTEGRKMLRPEIKEKSKAIASKVAGKTISDSDIADAIMIGKFVISNFETLEVIDSVI